MPVPKPSKRGRAIYIAVIAILLGVFVYTVYQVVVYLVQTNQAIQEEQRIQTMIAENESTAAPDITDDPSPVPTKEPDAEPTPAPSSPSVVLASSAPPAKPAVLIQFTKALEINPDTVGQLQMGESINTYVVQRDNSYYLRRSFSNEYSFSGAIFLDITCSIYPQSRNLIIHGHNMHNGTAFGKLSRFENVEYLNKYPFIEFSTLYESARYIPFAVVYYSIDPDSELYLDIYRVNSMTGDEFIQFVNHVQLISEYHIPVNVSRTDRIITVTTFATGSDDMRFAVFAVKSNR